MKKVLKIIGFVILALILAVVVYVGVLILTADTHNIDADNIYTKLAQRSTIYDDRGKEVESIYSEGGNRSNVSYEDLPEDLINAIVLTLSVLWERSKTALPEADRSAVPVL